jgi:HD-GYP domain-containing protein (c-di-GMP phosphodiesterase class II)
MTDIFQQVLDAGKVFVTPGQDEAEGYGPLPLGNLFLEQEIPFTAYLKIKEKGRLQTQLVKGCARGEVFRQDLYKQLLQLQIPCVYVSLEEMDRVMQYIYHHLDLFLRNDSQSELEKGGRICDAAHMWTINFFSNEGARSAAEIKGGIHLLDNLCQVIESAPHNLMRLLKIKRHKSFRLYSHCLNVCLLGLAFTSYLNWRQEKIKAFALGAMLHDIGLVRTPRAILEKKGILAPEEMERIKRHPIDGFRMVQGFVNLPWEALQMILQHHESGDGSGYPEGLKGPTIHTWARICRILDSYEAMTDKRPWREAMEPKDALWTMHSDWKRSKVFDQNYLRTFIKFLADQ